MRDYRCGAMHFDERDVHLKSHCPMRIVSCTFNCGQRVTFEELEVRSLGVTPVVHWQID